MRKLPAGLYAWAIFCLGLALLWSTSLRGAHVTGHDIQLEYFVYQITDQAGRWSMDAFRDPYNACLSLTILPVLIKSLTGITGLVAYKLLYPAILAAASAGVFVLARRFAGNRAAFVAGILFITFPTFTTDLPMLARQELAFAFFVWLLLVLFQAHLPRPARTGLAVLLALGMVLSHYSTTFTAVMLLAGTLVLSQLVRWGSNLNHWLEGHNEAPKAAFRAISLGIVVILLATTSVWTGFITRTADNIVATGQRSVHSLLHPGEKEQAESDNQAYLRGAKGQAATQARTDAYIQQQTQTAAPVLAEAGGAYAGAASYRVSAIPQPVQPLTALGEVWQRWGLDPGHIAGIVRTLYGTALELLIILAIFLAALWRHRWKQFHPDYLLLMPTAVALIAFQVIMPVVDYGMLRMLLQSLVFLALPAVLAGQQVLSWLRVSTERLQLTLISTALGAAFVFTSGSIPQLTGGFHGQLPLANDGFYYDAYYTTDSDQAAFGWLARNYPATQPPLLADMFTRMRLWANTGLVSHDGLAPTAIPQTSYVLLSGANVTDDRMAFYYQGELLFARYPTEFLSERKDLIYSNQRNEVYR